MRNAALLSPLLSILAFASLVCGAQAQDRAQDRAQEEPPFAPRVAFGRRLEPAGDKALHCAGQSAPAFAAYSAAVAPRAPAAFMGYASLGWADLKGPIARLGAELGAYGPDTKLQLGLDLLAPPRDSQSPQSPREPLDGEVAAGRRDGRVAELVAALKALDRPVFLRLGFEFNGEWNGYRPEPFKAAWRRVAAAIRAAGLSRVALVWCFAPQGRDQDFMRFYPGDDVVDWWAIDLFKNADFASPVVQAFLDAATARRFPVMIGESTPAGLGARAGDAWFARYFDFIARQPSIKAFCYIDWNWAEHPRWADWGDARIERDPDALARWRAWLARPGIENAQGPP